MLYLLLLPPPLLLLERTSRASSFTAQASPKLHSFLNLLTLRKSSAATRRKSRTSWASTASLPKTWLRQNPRQINQCHSMDSSPPKRLPSPQWISRANTFSRFNTNPTWITSWSSRFGIAERPERNGSTIAKTWRTWKSMQRSSMKLWPIQANRCTSMEQLRAHWQSRATLDFQSRAKRVICGSELMVIAFRRAFSIYFQRNLKIHFKTIGNSAKLSSFKSSRTCSARTTANRIISCVVLRFISTNPSIPTSLSSSVVNLRCAHLGTALAWCWTTVMGLFWIRIQNIRCIFNSIATTSFWFAKATPSQLFTKSKKNESCVGPTRRPLPLRESILIL